MTQYQPNLFADIQTNVDGERHFRVRILFGSSVVTSYRSKDVTVTRNSAGNYTLQFPKTYEEIVGFTFGMQDASGAILFWVITSETIQTNGQMVVECRTEAGTATDPTSGDKALLHFVLSDSIINQQYAG